MENLYTFTKLYSSIDICKVSLYNTGDVNAHAVRKGAYETENRTAKESEECSHSGALLCACRSAGGGGLCRRFLLTCEGRKAVVCRYARLLRRLLYGRYRGGCVRMA